MPESPRIPVALAALANHLVLFANELTRAAQFQDAFGAEIVPAHERHRKS